MLRVQLRGAASGTCTSWPQHSVGVTGALNPLPPSITACEENAGGFFASV